MSEENEELENEEIQEEQEPVNALELSDEEFMNMTEPLVPEESNDTDDQELESVEEENRETQEFTTEENEDGVQEQGQEEASEEEVAASAEEDEQKEAPSGIDYKAEYMRLIAPFKANGHQMQVASVDDALTLMQMGANYNKKMAGLKPNLRLLKMLEKNELLDESKINNLIDLSKQNPAAITDLLKKSGIDPLDIDTGSEEEYTPETYNVDDKEVELDEVLEGIQDTNTFNETIDIISNKWDGDSKKVLLDHPQLIGVINNHVASGIYGQIHEIIDNERAVGRLTDLSDIEAYKHVGDVINANGGFNRGPSQGQPQTQPSANGQQAPANKPKNPKLKSRKRAARSPKGSPSGAPAEFNPLNMSDEEFEKATAGML